MDRTFDGRTGGGRTTFVAVLASALLAVLVPASTVAAGGVGCADSIGQDTVLANDISGCTGDGLVIVADGITLDLNGHTISGDGVAGVDRIDAGIVVEGHHGIILKDGTLTGFDSGVLFDGVTASEATGLSVVHNAGRGIQLLNASTGNLIERNASSNNGRSGITTVGSGGNVLRNNVTDGNGFAGIASLDSNGNFIRGNEVVGNAEVGINVQSARNTVLANRVSRNGDGIIAVGDANVLEANQVTDAVGCEDNGCGFGITVEGGAGNLVFGNHVARTRRDAIRVQPFEDEGGPSMSSTVVRDNVTLDAGRFGIDVGADPDGSGTPLDTLVAGNLVINSVDAGIEVGAVSTTLTANRSIHNGGLGIEAIAGVVDGGGNLAAANGDAAQCLGVLC